MNQKKIKQALVWFFLILGACTMFHGCGQDAEDSFATIKGDTK